jgi:fucose permease
VSGRQRVDERAPARSYRLARPAVTGLFVAKGVIFATWVARIPTLKADHDLSDFELGITLLVVAGGSVVAMPLAGRVIAHVGSRLVAFTSALALCGFAATPFAFEAQVPFVLGLIAFGAANGVLDVAINAQGTAVEAGYRRPVLSSMHAAFSVGTIAGAIIGSAALRADLGPVTHVATVAALCSGIALVGLSRLLSPEHDANVDRRQRQRQRISWPLAACALIGFASLFCEGTIGDWSGVYLTDSLEAPEHAAAYGFAAFSVTMTIARFAGDGLTQRLGAGVLVRLSALLVLGGSVTLLATTVPGVAIVGFGFAGLGLANLLPSALRVASQLPGVRPSEAIATVTTTSYLAVMAGPGLIGMLSELEGLRTALVMMPLLAVVVLMLAGTLARASRSGSAERDGADVRAPARSREECHDAAAARQ